MKLEPGVSEGQKSDSLSGDTLECEKPGSDHDLNSLSEFLGTLRCGPLKQIIHAMPDAMIVTDESGIILAFNHTAEKMFGHRERDVLNRDVGVLMPVPAREFHVSYLRHYLESGSRASIIHRPRRAIGLRRNGTTFPHEITVSELNVGSQRLFVGFLRDIEDREAAERQMRLLHDELLHVSRVGAMGMMATALAHELNQPLAAVTCFVQTAAALLRSGAAVDDVCEAMDAAAKEAMRSGNIVRGLREFVMRGELEHAREPVSRLIADAVTLGMAGAHDLGIHCEVELAANQAIVIVDRIQVQQVLVNLIRNAIDVMKDTGGTIRILTRIRQGCVEIIVADDGPGIPPGRLASIFDAFVSGKKDGLGIGLSICRMIVEAHGGRIWARNRRGGGAAFSFTLPMAEEPDQ